MNCKKCGSFAFNLKRDGIDQGELCDVHYWQERAENAEKDAAYRLDTLKEVRETLEVANATPSGPINDTIWYSENETLFDFIDDAIAKEPK